MTRQVRKALIPVLIFLLALSLISMKFHARQGLSFVEAVVVEATAPVQKAVGSAADAIGNLWHGYFNLVGVQRENQQLREEIQKLKQQLNTYREAYLANKRLRGLLNFKKSMARPLLPAQVVAFDPSGWFQTVLIDKGRQDGVKRDMAVVSGAGLVGRIIGVSDHNAKVLLILDSNSAVDALVQRSRSRGVLVGRGNGECLLKYVQRNEDVQAGDQIISSGMGGVFPKGVLLGRVKEVVREHSGLFQSVTVEPAADFDRLEEIMVVLQSPPEDPERTRDGRGRGE